MLIIETKTGAPIEAGIADAAGAELPKRTGQIEQRAKLQLAVGPSETLRTGALVSGWGNILAGAIVQAGVMRATVVEILVAMEAAPVLVTDALVGREAVAILAARIGDALVATGPRPAGPAQTNARPVAVAVLLVAALLTLGHIAILAQPALRADLLASARALVVAKLVIARPAEGHAAVAIVLRSARDSKEWIMSG